MDVYSEVATVIKYNYFAYPTRLMSTVRSSNTDVESSQVTQYNGIIIIVILLSNHWL